MKFRAKLREPRTLLGALQICRSNQCGCILRLQEERTRFLTTLGMLDGVQVWIACRTEFLFSDFRCTSNYEEQSITCEILSLPQLMHILKQADARQSSNAANVTIVRLSMKGSIPYLKLTMQGSAQGLPDVTYDVPVRILSDREILETRAPPLEDDHVQVVIPSIPELSTFMDKLKTSACHSVTFMAEGYSALLSGSSAHGGRESGQKRSRDSNPLAPRLATFQVYAENHRASFSLKYDAVDMVPKLPPNNDLRDEDTPQKDNEEDDDEGSDASRAATVTVKVREFARFFAAIKEINPTRASLFLIDRRSLVLRVQAVGPTIMVAFIPAKEE